MVFVAGSLVLILILAVYIIRQWRRITQVKQGT